jgi:hypothetical protein
VVERQVTRRVRRMLGTIARAHVAVLADVARDHPPRQAGPSRISVNVMVGTDARQARMLAAASSRSARDDAADRAQLHPWMVYGVDDEVYSPAVLRLRGESPAVKDGSDDLKSSGAVRSPGREESRRTSRDSR